jgi:hypothetical protein
MGDVCLVGGIDDGQLVTSDDGGQSLVEQCRIRWSWAELASGGEEVSIDRCAEPYASHAMIIA